MKPRARVILVDARASHVDRRVLEALAADHAGMFAPHSASPKRGPLRVETDAHEIILEDMPDAMPLADRVKRARGADVAVVVAGRRTGDALQSLAILHGCGVRRVIVILTTEDAAASDLRENLGRHLLLDAGFDADDAPTLVVDGTSLGSGDLARLLDLFDAAVVPRADHDFLLSIDWAPDVDGVRHGVVAAGAVEAGTLPECGVLDHDGWANAVVDVTRAGRAGDAVAVRCDIDLDAGERAVLPTASTRRLVTAARFQVAPGSLVGRAPYRGGERCVAHGGAGGTGVSATLHPSGVLTTAAPIALVDGRVILAREQGAFWRVTSAEAHPLDDALEDDTDEVPFSGDE